MVAACGGVFVGAAAGGTLVGCGGGVGESTGVAGIMIAAMVGDGVGTGAEAACVPQATQATPLNIRASHRNEWFK